MMQQLTKTFNILLIEDNFTDAILLKRVFARILDTKYNLKRVELLKEGLINLHQDDFDIILLDLSLPDSFGIESLKKLQSIKEKVPIIVLTGTDNDKTAIAALREGAQDYLVKDNSINSKMFGRLLKRAIDHAIERKQIMEQLRHSEALYRGVIEDQTEFICRFLPDGKISFANSAFCRYLKVTSTDVLRKNFFFLIAMEDLSLIAPSINGLNEEMPNTVIEFRCNNTPESCWQQWNIRAIFQERNIVEYQAVGQDISDRKHAEIEKARLIASLHESQEKVRIITNSAPVLIWMTDTQGKPTFVNQFCLDFTGKSFEQALIEDWMSNIHLNNRQNYQRIYRNALTNKIYFETEYRLLNNEGEYRWIFQTGVPRFDPKGQFMGFVCSGIDISQRKKAEDLLAQQADRNYILAEITKHIHKSLKLDNILQTTADKVNSLLQSEAVIVIRIEGAEDLQILSKSTVDSLCNTCHLSPTLKPQLDQLNQNLDRLEAGQTVVLENLEHDLTARAADISRSQIQNSLVLENPPVLSCSAILVPIMVERKLWGILGVSQCSQPRVWLEEEIELLKQITRQLAIAIKQAELYQTIEKNNQQLQELAVIDGLTGIPNRRQFDQYLESEWKRLAREQSPLSLILCDLDHFKLYNDTYGHQAGDTCLRKVARAIQKTVKRPADLTARYGGEELAVILPNTSIEGAEKVAKNICRQIQALQIPHINSSTDLYVTLSLGVAGCIPRHDSSAQELLQKTDRNLYQAKKMGRNRVVTHQ